MRETTARFLAAAALVGLTALPAAGQVIVIEPRAYDFGNMKQQESRTTFFEIRNDGGGLLVIEDIKADCGCTVPTLTQSELTPGGSTQVEVRFDSKKFHGHVMKTVRIQSNDPVNPVLEFAVTADVHAALIVEPANQRVGFTREIVGNAQTGRVTFEATDIPELEISVEGTRKGLFEVKTIGSLDGQPNRAALEVVLPADAPPGRHRDNVRVRTNVPENETVDIEMSAWRIQSLTASPEEVNFRFKTILTSMALLKRRLRRKSGTFSLTATVGAFVVCL